MSASLFKWALTARFIGDRSLPTAPHCLVASLLAALFRSACSKSVIRPHKVDEKAGFPSVGSQVLHLWMLNPGFKFSSSNNGRVFTASKVLFRMISSAEADKLVDPISSDVQELQMPMEVIKEVWDLLIQTNLIIPQSQRIFQEFRVGLLERWR